MKQLELTPRLLAAAQLVPPGAAVADIGTDHAYLPVWLLKQGRVRYAIAADLRSGPLERAR
ncbi:MAG: tRNA (adenine(22)-N(1))-methyltransferase TrmK, partial [Oscillospiraceae bacterium]|nr:tRNA (adenine(22)-N(1))-methyltransferase TrmK [Oscillospiraceae bacterium]